MRTSALAILLACGVVALASSCVAGTRPSGSGGTHNDTVRVLSWNVSSDAFSREPAAFRALLTRANADVVLLDEVAPTMSESQLRATLAGRRSEGDGDWHVAMGRSGGRQRGVIATRQRLEPVRELSEVVPYPAAERSRLQALMTAGGEDLPGYSMDGGIPVNGAIVVAGTRRLLVVILDLQCCGATPASWQEDRRRVETRVLRDRVEQVLARTQVDGVIVAGDLNLVNTPVPLVVLSGPYPPPHAGLIAADLRHLDGTENWTWDGRDTPYPSRPMDFLLYGPHALVLREGYVLDSADLGQPELDRLKLARDAAVSLSRHLPLVTEFAGGEPDDQSSGGSPLGAILTSRGSNRARTSTRSCCAAIT
jgi:endonuclease/exonuclease/phosphatase family metal-dependent hydrolase